mgnify:CR=1 FL=1
MGLYENAECGVDTKDTAVVRGRAVGKRPERKVYGPSHFRQEILAATVDLLADSDYNAD